MPRGPAPAGGTSKSRAERGWLLLQVVHGLAATESGATVSYGAHFGGFALGLFLALAPAAVAAAAPAIQRQPRVLSSTRPATPGNPSATRRGRGADPSSDGKAG